MDIVKKVLMAAGIAAAIGVPFLMGQANTSMSSFEVADVHASAHTSQLFGINGVLRGTRYEIRTATMVDLIKLAYDLPEDDQVVGGPSWLATDRFDVIAKTALGTTSESLKKMLQNLLADRFKLSIHNDTKPINVYALTAGQKIRMKEASGSGRPSCSGGQQNSDGNAVPYQLLSCQNIAMPDFARLLKGQGAYNFLQPVVDQTNLKGTWDVDLKFTMRAQLSEAGPDGISLFDAVDKQLGLKLETKKVPMPVIVVDRVNEAPTDNLPGVAEAIPPAPTEFEVATIKPTDPNSTERPREGIQPGGRVDIHAITLKDIITTAWDISADMIVGVPKWLDSDRFDIVAKAPVPPAVPGAPAAPPMDADTLRAMLRTLIVERFQLVSHNETQLVNVYAFTVPSSGVTKLRKADPSNRSECKHTSGINPIPALSSSWTCTNTTIAQLAEQIRGWAPQYLDHPVVDLSGLTEAWDFTVSWTPKPLLSGVPGSDPSGGLSMFEAVDRELGLKLIPQKHALPVLVIDHVNEKPNG